MDLYGALGLESTEVFFFSLLPHRRNVSPIARCDLWPVAPPSPAESLHCTGFKSLLSTTFGFVDFLRSQSIHG